MKRNILILGASAASVLTFSALAESPAFPKPNGSQSVYQHIGPARTDRLNTAMKATEMVGMGVRNIHNEKMANVQDLAIDVEAGRLVHVILSMGGVLKIGNTLAAVPPGALHHDIMRKFLRLEADKDKLRTAPKFEMSRWAENSRTPYVAAIYSHYGQKPYFSSEESPEAAAILVLQKPEGKWSKSRISSENRLGRVQPSSKLLGALVENLQGEKLGKIENFSVDLSAGRIISVIVSSGGFLGMRDELTAVPPDALHFDQARNVFRVDISKETLGRAPHFKSNHWPDLTQPAYSASVYQSYNLEPSIK
jgi:sporulation protein YlmC with PRC-barrel domain